MTLTTGRVVAVNSVTLGDELVSDALAGATSVTVDDAADFSEDGGSVLIGEQVIAYATVDDATGLITFAPSETLAVDALEMDRVDLWDVERGAPVTEYIAHVVEDGAGLADDTLEATVDHSLIAYLPEGIREGQGESVTLERRGAGLFLINILGRLPLMDGNLIDPDTLPASGGSDGLAPVASPAPIVRGGVGSLFVLWDETANADPVSYAVHLSTSAGFTPDATNHVGTSTGIGPVVIRTLADGTHLVPGTTYRVVIVAFDEDGAAPQSTEASGTPATISADEIAANTIIGDHILANAITADKIAASAITADKIEADAINGKTITGATVRTAASGQRLVQDVDGLRLYTNPNTALTGFDTASASTCMAATADVFIIGDTTRYLTVQRLNGQPSYQIDVNSAPAAVTVGPSGHVFTAIAGKIVKTTVEATFVSDFGMTYSAADLAVASSGDIFTVDRVNSMVRVYTSAGTDVTSWSTTGVPEGIALDSAGNVYVTDSTNSLVRKYTSAGVAAGSWSTTGVPSAIRIDPSDRVIVAAQASNAVRTYDTAGASLATITTSSPRWLGVDPEGNVYSHKSDGLRVEKFSGVNTITAFLDPATGRLRAFEPTFTGVSQFEKLNSGLVTTSALSLPAGYGLSRLAARPFYKGYLAADFSVPNNVETKIIWTEHPTHSNRGSGTEFFSWNSAPLDGVITVKLTGFYRIRPRIKWATNTSSYRDFLVKVNNAVAIEATSFPGGAKFTQTLTEELYLNANDTISLHVKQNSGSALALDGGATLASTFGIEYIGPRMV